MRSVLAFLVPVLLATLVGCGNSKQGPVTPTEMTAEQKRAFEEEQKKIDQEEGAQSAQEQRQQPRAGKASPRAQGVVGD